MSVLPCLEPPGRQNLHGLQLQAAYYILVSV